MRFGQDFPDDFILPPPPEPIPLSITLPDVVAFTGDPGYIDYFGDPGLYEPHGDVGDESLYVVPDLPTAVRVSMADVLRGSYEPTAGEMATANQAVAEIVATRDAGGDWQRVLGQWGTTLSDTLRSAMPAIVNRVLGQSPSGGIVVSRRAAVGGTNWTPILIIGGALLLITVMGTGGRGRAAVKAPRASRAPRQAKRRR